jgi:hypothetical protein
LKAVPASSLIALAAEILIGDELSATFLNLAHDMVSLFDLGHPQIDLSCPQLSIDALFIVRRRVCGIVLGEYVVDHSITLFGFLCCPVYRVTVL